jgi:hypothetical protein
MTDIEQKALALLNVVEKDMGLYRSKALSPDNPAEVALCRAIEQHEAFRHEVSDTLHEYIECFSPPIWRYLNKFIIPKPDPLVEVIAECDDGTWETKTEYAEKFRAALEARGLEIREKNDG